MKNSELNFDDIVAEKIVCEPQRRKRGRPRTSPEGQPRRLFVLSKENTEFLTNASRAMALTYSEFINMVLNSYQNAHQDLCNNIKKDVQEIENRRKEI